MSFPNFILTSHISSYVVYTKRGLPATWSQSDSNSTTRPSAKAEEIKQVFIGIFPASHIIIREELADAEGRLQDLASSMHTSGSANGSIRSGVYGRTSPADVPNFWVKDKSSIMDTVKEED